jgi:hypothetical protein
MRQPVAAGQRSGVVWQPDILGEGENRHPEAAGDADALTPRASDF